MPIGLHAVMGAGIIKKCNLDSFLIIQDPFAPCKGCKYWINTKCYTQPLREYFTIFDQFVLVIKDTSNLGTCQRTTTRHLDRTETKCLKILDSIRIDLTSSKLRYNLVSTSRVVVNNQGRIIGTGYNLVYKNDFFIVIQPDIKKPGTFTQIEVGFCPYVLEKTVIEANETYVLSLAEDKDATSTTKATILSISGYPNNFYSFYILKNGIKEHYLSPFYNDFKLKIRADKAYKAQDIFNKFN
jgi:hypothetical protein